jgi:uncharacterized zinc-type alcohol dehydrogenase-like protein
MGSDLPATCLDEERNSSMSRATYQDAPHSLLDHDHQGFHETHPGEGAEATKNGPITSHAWGAASATSPLEPIQIQRRALGVHDVLLDVLYCGVCHSDIHTLRGEWGPTPYPCVPGHEIIGKVQAIGSAVTKFKVGDVGGVGCMVNACCACDNCRQDLEQYCLHGSTMTYGSPDAATKGHTLGGYSDKIVVTERFVIRIPPGADLAATAPLLCAGVTTFSPMQHWKLGAGQHVGVIGLGGLGHMALKLAVSRKAEVTVFTTSQGKLADAHRMGAKHAVLSTDAESMRKHGKFDLMISTVPQGYPMQPFLDLLKLDGTLVNVGALGPLEGINGLGLAMGRKSLAGSMIGGIAETQEVIDYCAARGIKAEIELIGAKDINKAYERVVNKDVRYRFVMDVASMG